MATVSPDIVINSKFYKGGKIRLDKLRKGSEYERTAINNSEPN